MQIQYSTYSCTVYETLIRPLARALKVERMRKSREYNHDFSAVCVLITKHIAKFRTKLENSHSDLRFFVRSFGWNLVQLLGNFHPNFGSFQAQWEWPYRSQNVTCADLARCQSSGSRSTVRWGPCSLIRLCISESVLEATSRCSEWICFEPRAHCHGVAREMLVTTAELA